MKLIVDLEDFDEIQKMLQFTEQYIKSRTDLHYEYHFEYKLQYRHQIYEVGCDLSNPSWSEWKDIE